MSPFVQVVWPGGDPGDVTVRTAAAGDSYYAQYSTGTYGTNTRAYMPYSTHDGLAFARFALAIPNAATITLAEFTWTCSRYPSNTLVSPADDMDVSCEAADSAAQITDRTTLLSRYASAGAAVAWSSDVVISENESHTSSDIKAAVQTVVNRVGWASGNYLGVFVYHGGSGTADSVAWYLHAGTATTTYHPQLYVEYTS